MPSEPKHKANDSDLEEFLSELASGGSDRTRGCPPVAMVRVISAGVLPEAEQARISKHVAGCGVCQALVGDFEDAEVLRITRQQERRLRDRIFNEIQPTGARRWSFGFTGWKAAFLVSSAVVVVALSLLLWQHAAPSRAVPRQTSAVALTPTVPDVLQLDKPQLEAAPHLTWRGAGPQERLQVELEEALEPYRSGNYSEARTLLQRISTKYPRSAEAFFYAGICDLYLKQDAAAAENLDRARNLGTAPQAKQATWYLSIALVREGKRAEARTLLTSLCHSAGPDQTRACEAATELSR